jgi:hypothetical protein
MPMNEWTDSEIARRWARLTSYLSKCAETVGHLHVGDAHSSRVFIVFNSTDREWQLCDLQVKWHTMPSAMAAVEEALRMVTEESTDAE